MTRILALVALLASAAASGPAAVAQVSKPRPPGAGKLHSATSTVSFADGFDTYATLTDVAGAWDLSPGWERWPGALAATGPGHALAVAFACPEISAGQIRAAVTPQAAHRPQARASTGGWAAAGVMLYQGPDHYWRVALVESPAGQRYCELVEQYGGIWQAQAAGRTALPAQEAVATPWEFGKTYDLIITHDGASITGEVRTVDNQLVFSRTYRLSAAIPAVRSGRAALEVMDMRASFDDVSASGESAISPRRGSGPLAAAILSQAGGEEIARLAAAALKNAGLETRVLDAEALSDAKRFGEAGFDVLVLPRSEAIPGPAVENLLAFLRGGGHLIAFGGPAFQRILWPWHGEWKSADEILGQVRAETPILDFSHADLLQWTRASSNPASPVEYKAQPAQNGAQVRNPSTGSGQALRHLSRRPDGSAALQVRVGDLTGWETFASPPLADPFPGNQAVTCFRAKGGPRTDHLIVEWNERDGSRWIAAVELAREWRYYALRPQDFKFWRDSPTTDRGGAGDVFNPQQAERIVFGLAQSHSPIPTGEHEYWVADVGAAPSPFPAAAPEPPMLEAMSPWYKVYETQAELVQADPDQGFFAPAQPAAISGRLLSPVWRQRGLGAGAGQRGRWIPLLRASTREGQYRGAAASTYLATSGPYRGATWTYVGLDAETVRDNWKVVEPVIAGLAQRLAGGLLLASAGTDRFSYFAQAGATDGPTAPRLVARVINLGAKSQSAQVRLAVTDTAGQALFESTPVIAVEPGAIAVASADGPALPAGRYRAVCELLSADGSPAPIDRIAHEFSIIGPPGQPEFMTVRDGDFHLGGNKWYPHGVNFWPLYVAGLERFDYWLHWLSPAQYDPEAVERDLATLESLGANMVSIQYGNVDQAPALNDFLQRAKAHGIHANVFIPGTHPLAFDPDLAESLVSAARLADSDAIFAYDLAWEPRLGGEPERRQYDDRWAAWIEGRYGSVEAAEKDWGCSLPRDDGRPTGPTDAQLVEDGEHRRMVAAYRRFADDLISQGYGRVTRFLRRLDPHHLFGARTGYGGTGQRGVAAVMPFDLVSGAAHLDFASPEGWGLWGEWKNFERAGFTTLYGRWASAGKPVFWSEFGYTIYPGTTPEKYDSQAEVYRNLYHMALQSGANGSAGWWFPGGLRVDENSDFGIISPDGTPRAAAQELRRAAAGVTAPRDRPAPDTWIAINRDAYVSGYAGIWDEHADEYAAAARAGRTVGLRTEADGATTADVLLVAVGDVPCDGGNPPKYLNAEFVEVVVLDTASGDPMPVTAGGVIEVEAGRPLRLRVEAINTGVAAWLSPGPGAGKPGAVYVGARVGRGCVSPPQGRSAGLGKPALHPLRARAGIPRDVPRYGSVEFEFSLAGGVSERTDVTLAVFAERPDFEPASGRLWFGQRLRFTLAPKGPGAMQAPVP